MDIISILIVLVVLGLIVYLVGLLPIDERFKGAIRVLLIGAGVLYLLAVVTGRAELDFFNAGEIGK